MVWIFNAPVVRTHFKFGLVRIHYKPVSKSFEKFLIYGSNQKISHDDTRKVFLATWNNFLKNKKIKALYLQILAGN